MIVESLQKGAIRETYVNQVKAVNRALGLEPKEQDRRKWRLPAVRTSGSPRC
jgi:hypothetical protein